MTDLFIKVGTNYEDLEDAPEFVRVEVNEHLRDVVHFMAGVVNSDDAKVAEVVTVSRFEYTPDWYTANTNDPDVDMWREIDNALLGDIGTKLPHWKTCTQERMDACQLHVDRCVLTERNRFWWTGYIKHTNFEMTTRRVPIEKLDEILGVT